MATVAEKLKAFHNARQRLAIYDGCAVNSRVYKTQFTIAYGNQFTLCLPAVVVLAGELFVPQKIALARVLRGGGIVLLLLLLARVFAVAVLRCFRFCFAVG